MVQLPTGPTITCGFGSVPVAVVATYAGGIVPISRAKVSFKAAFFGFYGGGDVFYTDPIGIAQNCYVLSAIGLGAFIQKDDIDFGDGVGVEHFIGDSGIRTGPYMFPKVVARTSVPLPPSPCTGVMGYSLPDFTSILKSPTMPTSIIVPITATVRGEQQLIPIKTYVDGREYPFGPLMSGGIDVLAAVKYFFGQNESHTIRIESRLANCKIDPVSFTVPKLVPLTPAILPCSGLMSIVQPTFPSLLSGPVLPGSIPVPVSITGSNLPQNIPLSVLVDGNEVTRVTGVRNGSVNIDILSIISPYLRNTGHTIDIRSALPDCNISSPPSINVPKLVPTGIKQSCTEGETQTFRCPDGSEIVIARCQRDPITGINVFVPTGEKCPIVQPPPPPGLGKTVKILTYPEGAALEAYDGMEVTVTASVVCGVTPSSGETAIFSVDGNEVVRVTTSTGLASFKWTATVEPSRTHKLCVSVPKSSQCPNFGEARDCKTITVSRAVPDVLERLKKERESYLSQLEGQRIERERIREISLNLPQPQLSVPGVTVPAIPEVPTTPSIPVPPPVEEQVPGIIDIPVVKTPPGMTYLVEVRIDGNIIGQPPVYKEVTPGTHTVTISLKGFTPISKKVNLSPGQILTIEEAFT